MVSLSDKYSLHILRNTVYISREIQCVEPEPDFELRDFLQRGGSLLFLFVAGIYGSPETIGLILFQMLSHSHSRRNTAPAAQKYISLKEEMMFSFHYLGQISFCANMLLTN